MKAEIERLCNRYSFPREKQEKNFDKQPDSFLRELEWLAGYSTDSSNPNSMAQKDENATKAIMLAGEMLRPTLKWAIDHFVGRAKLRRAPVVPPGSQARNDLRIKERIKIRSLRANSHENEWIGNKYDGLDPRVNREACAEIFYLLSRSLGFKAGETVSVALKALDKGEVYPELERVSAGRMANSMELDRYRLFAVGHVEFRKSQGGSLESAMADVCNAYTVSEDALKKWRKNNCECLKAIDEVRVADYLFHARQMGLLVASKKNQKIRSKLYGQLKLTDFASKSDLAKIDKAAERYSQVRLEADGERYRQFDAAARQRQTGKKKK